MIVHACVAECAGRWDSRLGRVGWMVSVAACKDVLLLCCGNRGNEPVHRFTFLASFDALIVREQNLNHAVTRQNVASLIPIYHMPSSPQLETSIIARFIQIGKCSLIHASFVFST